MVSDIKGLDARQTTGTRTRDTGAVRKDGQAAASSRSGESKAPEDTVELSGLAEVIQTAARKLAAEPAVDHAKVQDVRNAVANGSYQVDPERLARKLIDADNA